MSYGGNDDRGHFLNVVNWAFNSIALAAFLLRLASRHLFEKKEFTIDDGLLVVAMGLNLGRAIFVSTLIESGFGQHLMVLLEADPIATTKLLHGLINLQAIGLWTFCAPKLPLAALLVRIFTTGVNRSTKFVIWSLAISLHLLALVATTITFLQCNPVAKNWNPMLPGTCWPRSYSVNVGYALGAYSAFIDFAFSLYPILQISKLNMERNRKVLIASSLSLGFIACITTCYKQSTVGTLLEANDPTWATVPLEVWNSVEGCTLLIAVSIPLTRPLMVTFGQRFVALTSRFSGSTNSKGFSLGSTRAGDRSTHNRSGYKIQDSKDHIALDNTYVGATLSDDGRTTKPSQDGIRVQKSIHVSLDTLRSK